ncbi:MAG: phosphatase PAP2 family protein [Calditrichaeota bacterium]|nr:phosphatase PAP2 family protein [Calditrichota bacterium]
MKKLTILFSALIFIFILQQNLFAGVKDNLCSDGKHFAEIGLKLFIAPSHFQKSDWEKLGIITATTGMLFFVDDEVQNIALKNQHSKNDRIFALDKFYGNKYTIMMTVGIYGIGLFCDKPAVRRMGLNSFESFLYSAFLSTTLKALFGRHRPDVGDGHLLFTPFQIKDMYQSLPSGHATVSMAVSAAMAKSLDNFVWKLFWYSSGGLVAASRIYHNRHWASDVFLGATIGYFVADFVVKFDRKNEKRITGKILPFSNGRNLGVAIAF